MLSKMKIWRWLVGGEWFRVSTPILSGTFWTREKKRSWNEREEGRENWSTWEEGIFNILENHRRGVSLFVATSITALMAVDYYLGGSMITRILILLVMGGSMLLATFPFWPRR